MLTVVMIVFIHLCYFLFTDLILHNHLIPSVDFMFCHPDCFSDVVILSSVRLTSLFVILHYCSIACSFFPSDHVKVNPIEYRWIDVMELAW